MFVSMSDILMRISSQMLLKTGSKANIFKKRAHSSIFLIRIFVYSDFHALKAFYRYKERKTHEFLGR